MAPKTEDKAKATAAEADAARPEGGALTAAADPRNQMPVEYEGLEEFAGLGMENVDAGELLVPRFTILQDLSPQLKERKAEYIEGAKVGQICDVGLGKLYGDNMHFLPIYYRKDYLEWAPRASGGGLVNIHNDPAILEQTTINDRKKRILSNGNTVEETAQFFGFVMEDGAYRPAFIPMASTQLKKARKWLTLSDGEYLPSRQGKIKAPLFWRVYKLGTAEEDNPQGEWIGWTVERDLTLPEYAPDDWRSIMDAAKSFLESLRRGEAVADMSNIDGTEGGTVVDGEYTDAI